MSCFFRYLVIAGAVLVYGCAQQVAPKGGDKDKIPPQIVKSSPRNESVQFTRRQISMEFDEFVTLKGANKELIVSPPLKYPVEFKLKGKKVILSWRDTLRENTTYTFQFGNGIVDVNEQNPLDSNVFVFSTGSYIDSFTIRGRVMNAYELKPEKDVWVMLYDRNVDSLPYKELPRYFAKTDNTGNFELKYLRPGQYKCFALKPVNSGYTYDVPGEGIAFTLKPVAAANPSDSSKKPVDVVLNLFVEDDSTQYVKSYEQLANQGLMFEFNRPVAELKLRELAGTKVDQWTPVWSDNRDTVRYWFDRTLDYDSLKLELSAGSFRDTIFLRKPPVKSDGGRRRGKRTSATADRLTLSTNAIGKLPYFGKLSVWSQTPLASQKGVFAAILVEDKDTIAVKKYLKTNFYGFTVNYPWKQDTRYQFIVPDSAMKDRFGLSNDSLVLSFIATRKEDYGQLIVTYSLPDRKHPFIWQLLQKDGIVVDERVIRSKGKVSYDHLLTGAYRVRLIFDEDANGKWSTGYYPAKRQPERVVNYNQPIDVRSNWLTEIDWELK